MGTDYYSKLIIGITETEAGITRNTRRVEFDVFDRYTGQPEKDYYYANLVVLNGKEYTLENRWKIPEELEARFAPLKIIDVNEYWYIGKEVGEREYGGRVHGLKLTPTNINETWEEVSRELVKLNLPINALQIHNVIEVSA